MRANCWMGKTTLEVREVPDPKILNARDAIVRITSTAICGSDLHLYNGFIPTIAAVRASRAGRGLWSSLWLAPLLCLAGGIVLSSGTLAADRRFD